MEKRIYDEFSDLGKFFDGFGKMGCHGAHFCDIQIYAISIIEHLHNDNPTLDELIDLIRDLIKLEELIADFGDDFQDKISKRYKIVPIEHQDATCSTEHT
jgi:site-specific DNA-cytosine methylase